MVRRVALLLASVFLTGSFAVQLHSARPHAESASNSVDGAETVRRSWLRQHPEDATAEEQLRASKAEVAKLTTALAATRAEQVPLEVENARLRLRLASSNKNQTCHEAALLRFAGPPRAAYDTWRDGEGWEGCTWPLRSEGATWAEREDRSPPRRQADQQSRRPIGDTFEVGYCSPTSRLSMAPAAPGGGRGMPPPILGVETHSFVVRRRLDCAERTLCRLSHSERTREDIRSEYGADEFLVRLEGAELVPCVISHLQWPPCAYVARCPVSIPGRYHVVVLHLRSDYRAADEDVSKWREMQYDKALGDDFFMDFYFNSTSGMGKSQHGSIYSTIVPAAMVRQGTIDTSLVRASEAALTSTWAQAAKGEICDGTQGRDASAGRYVLAEPSDVRLPLKELAKWDTSVYIRSLWKHRRSYNDSQYRWLPYRCAGTAYTTRRAAGACLEGAGVRAVHVMGDSHASLMYATLRDYYRLEAAGPKINANDYNAAMIGARVSQPERTSTQWRWRLVAHGGKGMAGDAGRVPGLARSPSLSLQRCLEKIDSCVNGPGDGSGPAHQSETDLGDDSVVLANFGSHTAAEQGTLEDYRRQLELWVRVWTKWRASGKNRHVFWWPQPVLVRLDSYVQTMRDGRTPTRTFLFNAAAANLTAGAGIPTVDTLAATLAMVAREQDLTHYTDAAVTEAQPRVIFEQLCAALRATS